VAEKGTEVTLDEAEKELRDLAKGIDIEEILAKANQDEAEDGEDDDDEIEEEISPEDREQLDASMRPVRMVLVKVSYSR
jgi:hypothetical protein